MQVSRMCIKHELLHHKGDASGKHVFCLKYFCVKKLLIVVVFSIVLSSGACSFNVFFFGWLVFFFQSKEISGGRKKSLVELFDLCLKLWSVSLAKNTAKQHRQFNPLLFFFFLP